MLPRVIVLCRAGGALLLLVGASGCLVRYRQDLTPSEHRALVHCDPQPSGDSTQDRVCRERSWSFLLDSEQQSTCQRDSDCFVIFAKRYTDAVGPDWIAPSHQWWQREGEARFRALPDSCGITDYIIANEPEGATCQQGRCRLRFAPQVMMTSPKDAACYRKFSAPMQVPAWP